MYDDAVTRTAAEAGGEGSTASRAQRRDPVAARATGQPTS